MCHHSHFSYIEIAKMWDTSHNVVKYIANKKRVFFYDGEWKFERRKEYTRGTYNVGWKNLIPGGPHGKRSKEGELQKSQ